MTPDLAMALHELSARWPDFRHRDGRLYSPSLGIAVTRPPAHRRTASLQWQASHLAADVCGAEPVGVVEALVRALGGGK